MKVRAIIFDFDGTLADSESIHFESWKTVLMDEFGIDFGKLEYFANFAGIPTPTLAGILKERYGLQVDAVDLSRRKESIAMKKLAHSEILFMPFAKEVLEKVHKANTPISIVTGSRRKEMEPFLKKEGIIDYFDYIITRDDVKISKPHPEGYLKCAELMGFRPDEYLVFEDTWGGVTSAKEASLLCFGIQKDEELRSKLAAAGADYTFQNLKGLGLSFGSRLALNRIAEIDGSEFIERELSTSEGQSKGVPVVLEKILCLLIFFGSGRKSKKRK